MGEANIKISTRQLNDLFASVSSSPLSVLCFLRLRKPNISTTISSRCSPLFAIRRPKFHIWYGFDTGAATHKHASNSNRHTHTHKPIDRAYLREPTVVELSSYKIWRLYDERIWGDRNVSKRKKEWTSRFIVRVRMGVAGFQNRRHSFWRDQSHYQLDQRVVGRFEEVVPCLLLTFVFLLRPTHTHEAPRVVRKQKRIEITRILPWASVELRKRTLFWSG